MVMKKYIVDTNVLLRYTLNDIEQQANIVEEYISLAFTKKIKLIIPLPVIFEMEYVLRKFYKTEKSLVILILMKLILAPFFAIDQQKELLETLVLYEAKDLDFVDLFLYVTARERKAELLTFDKALKAM